MGEWEDLTCMHLAFLSCCFGGLWAFVVGGFVSVSLVGCVLLITFPAFDYLSTKHWTLSSLCFLDQLCKGAIQGH